MSDKYKFAAQRGVGSSAMYIVGALLAAYGLWLLVCTLGRLGLFIWQHGRLDDLSFTMAAMAFVHGLRMDTMALCYLLVPPMLLLTLSPAWLSNISGNLVRIWVVLILALLVFIEIATFPFFAEYDVRPNVIFVEYLKYPDEVLSMLWKDQKLNLGIAALAMTAVVWWFFRLRLLGGVRRAMQSSWWRRALWCLPLLVLLFAGIRSSAAPRPANISDALYSANRVANEIAKNSLYSIAYDALRSRKDAKRLAPSYGEMSTDEAYRRAYALLGRSEQDPQRPFLHTIVPTHPAAKPRNLVILLQESLGAQFTGFAGGGHSVTPRIDALAQDSVAFTQLYSNGTRSIRGIAAMTAGALPLVGEGEVKRPKSQRNFFTLASLLKPLGYHASFIYGGAARFDDMKSWYLGNGFDEVIEQKDYPHPTFVSTWGVSDEDLMIKAHERFNQLSATGKPFVSVVFSSSNHTPFELPDGKIEWEPGVPRKSVQNAIKYADYAVGRFFEMAKQSPYYQDTVFVVVADHNVRVYGDDAVPVSAFHIPGLIHLAGVSPLRFEGVATQPDLLSTALGMIGVELKAPVMGNSIFDPQRSPFVMMQFNDTYGFWQGDEVAVLHADKPAETYHLTADRHLTPAAADTELERNGLALLHVTEDMYVRGLYRDK